MEANEKDEASVMPKSIDVCGIGMKKNYSKRNLLAIFYLSFFVTAGGGYFNVQVVYLLRDKDYFTISEGEQGRVIAKINTVALIAMLGMTIVAGYIFDLCGRRVPILMAGFVIAIALLVVPYSAPSIIFLSALRTIFGLGIAQIGAHPLIMDSIKKESRGKASALNGLGALLGEAFAMVVLFGYSKRDGVTQEEAFRFAAIFLLALAIITLFVVKEPNSKKEKKNENNSIYNNEEIQQSIDKEQNKEYKAKDEE